MKDIEIKLENEKIHSFEEIKGTVTINYTGKYDGIVINTQILSSNYLIIYKSYNGKKISQNVSRLFVNKDDIPQNIVEFSAVIEFVPKEIHEVKFRASIIEQHKEIENAILFAELLP